MDRRHLYFLLFLLCTIQAAIGQQRSFSIKGVVKDAPGGVIVTYCAKGEVRRGMQAAGFEMSRLPGPPGKRHILRGIKN